MTPCGIRCQEAGLGSEACVIDGVSWHNQTSAKAGPAQYASGHCDAVQELAEAREGRRAAEAAAAKLSAEKSALLKDLAFGITVAGRGKRAGIKSENGWSQAGLWAGCAPRGCRSTAKT